ncbi:MAG: damage-inducible protein DinB [Oceanospirillaceae bacterium]|nr:damage-inducible protein DinB [Oceanospirillaceae bacterium]|tara:strand:+ start:1294 stop:1839 length:546 start_codon:yes stop_codon:yes gene_type:complete
MENNRHFLLMAQYNQRMNHQVYEAASRLTDAELRQNLGAFFGSVIGTLNHLMVGDLIWLRRFAKHSAHYQTLNQLGALPVPTGLDDLIFNQLPPLEQTRKRLDQLILDWLESDVRSEDLHRTLVYQNTRGIAFERDFGELLSHLFNHQTHHRGQVSTLLSQLGQDVGVTDFLLDIPDVSDS